MLLNELLKAIQPVQVTGDSRIEITGVNIDSRLVEAGQLFMAMRGTQTDGHAYIPAAIQKGATAILCEDLPEEPVAGITYIQVKDSEDAVGKIATTFYGNPTSQFELVGVTGTNGKTTIATLLYNTFRYFGYKVGLISTVCNYIDDQPIPTEHTKPGITKGQHWHHTKNEKFVVVHGHGLIQLRKVGTDENGQPYPVVNYEVSGEKIRVVEMIPGYTHNIVNLSQTEDLVTFIWCNECFDPKKPDTYFEPVE